MILATYKCGCPPKEEKPCSPCCASKRVTIKSGTHSKNFPSAPRIDESPQCCPTDPSDDGYQRPSKLRSEIADKGLPYKEIEAIINNNRVVIRTQIEPGVPEYEPPCDCVQDGLPARQIEPDETQLQGSGNRTVTLYSRPADEDNSSNLTNDDEKVPPPKRMTIEQAENPNIFLFRMKKRCVSGDKKYGIDVEFKTPRPWSMKKRQEYMEQQIQPTESAAAPTMKRDDIERKATASGRCKRRKRH